MVLVYCLQADLVEAYKISGVMCMSQAPIAREQWNHPRIVCNNNTEKEQAVAGEGGPREVGQHFSGINVLVLAPGDKQNMVQGRKKVDKWA